MKILLSFLLAITCLSAASIPSAPAMIGGSVQLFAQKRANDDFSDFEAEFSAPVADPLSGYNRFMTDFNDVLYKMFLKHIFISYDALVPNPMQDALDNFFANLMFPIRFVNNLLQGKFENAGDEIRAFVVNTTIGVGGLIDIAGRHGIKTHEEDFGQTLGAWGIGPGVHIVLPLIGQSNLRDAVGLVGDYFLMPTAYADRAWGKKPLKTGYIGFSVNSAMFINTGSKDSPIYEKMTKDVIDLYPFIKDAYEQRRAAQIKE